MSIASEITRINTNIAAAYSSCSDKGAALPQTQNSANLADTIDSIPQGGGEVEDKDVNFYDFDGTRLYSYTLQEASALSELPPVPTHDDLVAVGWNYTLSQIQTAAAEKPVDVGAMYDTLGGKTRLYLTADDSDFPEDVNLHVTIRNGTLTVAVNGTTVAVETESAESNVNHTINFDLPSAPSYPADYVVELSFSGSGYYVLGQGNVAGRILGRNVKQTAMMKRMDIGDNCQIGIRSFQSCTSLKNVVISSGVQNLNSNCFNGCASLSCLVVPSGVTGIGTSAFFQCASLQNVVFPLSVTSLGPDAFHECTALRKINLSSSVTSVGSGAFQSCNAFQSVIIPSGLRYVYSSMFSRCTSLKKVVISQGILEIGTYAFYNCVSLMDVTLPSGVTYIGMNSFSNCLSLYHIEIPSSVTSIGSDAFSGCTFLRTMDLSEYTDPSALPILGSVSSLYGTPSDQIIYVHDQTMLDAFSAATNWSTYASRFRIKGA